MRRKVLIPETKEELYPRIRCKKALNNIRPYMPRLIFRSVLAAVPVTSASWTMIYPSEVEGLTMVFAMLNPRMYMLARARNPVLMILYKINSAAPIPKVMNSLLILSISIFFWIFKKLKYP